MRRSLLFSDVRVHSYCTIEDSVLLPGVVVNRDVTIRRAIVDRSCELPPGFAVGVDAEADRKRFHVTPRGIALITPEMIGQMLHHLR